MYTLLAEKIDIRGAMREFHAVPLDSLASDVHMVWDDITLHRALIVNYSASVSQSVRSSCAVASNVHVYDDVMASMFPPYLPTCI